MTLERYFHGLWSSHWLDVVASVAAEYGLYLCAALLVVAWIRRRPRGALLPFVIGALVAGACVAIAGSVYHDTRPFVVLGVAPLVQHGVDNGFPSDHAAAAGFAAIVTLFFDAPLGAIASFAAIALGVARLFCLLHSPIDVVAGWAIGALCALAAGAMWKRYAGSSPAAS